MCQFMLWILFKNTPFSIGSGFWQLIRKKYIIDVIMCFVFELSGFKQVNNPTNYTSFFFYLIADLFAAFCLSVNLSISQGDLSFDKKFLTNI